MLASQKETWYSSLILLFFAVLAKALVLHFFSIEINQLFLSIFSEDFDHFIFENTGPFSILVFIAFRIVYYFLWDVVFLFIGVALLTKRNKLFMFFMMIGPFFIVSNIAVMSFNSYRVHQAVASGTYGLEVSGHTPRYNNVGDAADPSNDRITLIVSLANYSNETVVINKVTGARVYQTNIKRQKVNCTVFPSENDKAVLVMKKGGIGEIHYDCEVIKSGRVERSASFIFEYMDVDGKVNRHPFSVFDIFFQSLI